MNTDSTQGPTAAIPTSTEPPGTLLDEDVRNRPRTVLASRYAKRWGLDAYEDIMPANASWIQKLARMTSTAFRELVSLLTQTFLVLLLTATEVTGHPLLRTHTWILAVFVFLQWVLFMARYLRRVLVKVSQ